MAALLTALAVAAAAAPPARGAAAEPRAATAVVDNGDESQRRQLDALLHLGFDDPDRALQALAAWQATIAPGGRIWHDLLRAYGQVAADAGRVETAQAAARSLEDLANAAPAASAEAALAQGDAALVRALLGEALAQPQAAADAAQQALAAYARAATAADPRATWLAEHLLARQLSQQGRVAQARAHALRALERARQGLDNERQVLTLALAATLSTRAGDLEAALPLWAQARRLAVLEARPRLHAQLALAEYGWHLWRGNEGQLRATAERGLELARRARSPRLQALHRVNLSDAWLREHRPAQALAEVERAMPVLRDTGNRRAELAMLGNAALARIGLGRFEAASSTLDELLALHESSGAATDQLALLREFADAFAAAGQLDQALELYHRERRVATRLWESDRQARLAGLRERFDQEAQQRRLDQLVRDSELLKLQLANQAAARQQWLGGVAAMLLAAAGVGLLYHRVRRANRQLRHKRASLHALSLRDPLTGLANRRALQQVVAEQGLDRSFAGALLLVDIDHFKQVNDSLGHTRGDVVLMEVSRRLSETVRDQDLVVRWGGEEFLLLLPGVRTGPARELAERVLQAVGGTPTRLPDGTQRTVQVSVGYATFPLGPTRLPLPLDRALHLVDLALYAAKNQGRNRALGIAALHAADADELASIEADFERACRGARVALVRSLGPAAAAAAADAADAPAAAAAAAPGEPAV